MNNLAEKNRNNSEQGQSLLEFSISLVVLLVLLAGLADVGRALFTYMSLRDAAQEGALYGSYNPTDSAGIQTRISNNSNMLNDLVSAGRIVIGVSHYGSGYLSKFSDHHAIPGSDPGQAGGGYHCHSYRHGIGSGLYVKSLVM